MRFLSLDDGRKLCLECLDSAIMDTNECQPLYLEIQEFYEGLNMKLEQQVPLLLVERQALNEAMEGEKHVKAYKTLHSTFSFYFFPFCFYSYPSLFFCFFFFNYGKNHHMPETRGLCLSEEHTVSTVRIPSNSFKKFMVTLRCICLLC